LSDFGVLRPRCPTASTAVQSNLTATRGPVRIIGNVKGKKSTLQAIAVAQQQSSTTSEPIHYVHIHKGRGDHIKTTIHGEVVEDRMGGMPASMPSSAPLAVARVPSGISAPSVRARRSLATPG